MLPDKSLLLQENWWKIPKFENQKCDILSYFQTLCIYSNIVQENNADDDCIHYWKNGGYAIRPELDQRWINLWKIMESPTPMPEEGCDVKKIELANIQPGSTAAAAQKIAIQL